MGAGRPLITLESLSLALVRSEELGVVVRRIKIWKRRGILIALRAVVIGCVGERSSLQNGQRANCAISVTAFS